MTSPETIRLRFSLNGRDEEIEIEPGVVLADVLREEFGLTGTKVSCDQGACGACTVVIDGRPVASCTEFAYMVAGRSVTTIEGLGSASELHPIQRAFLEAAALQCGFCTPGMIMLLDCLLREHPNPDDATLRSWLSSNFCRCTGYQPIMDAALLAAGGPQGQGGDNARA